jgi:E3 ubiquitin-protein ligase UBR1
MVYARLQSSDLRYLCHNESVQKLVAHNHDFIAEFAKVCQLFMCINPNKRAATSHVEYQPDAWICVFNVTLSLSRVVKVYGEAFVSSTTTELVATISTVIHRILLVCTMAHDHRRDRHRCLAVVFHRVNFAGAGYTVVKFDVAEGWKVGPVSICTALAPCGTFETRAPSHR